MDRLERLLSQRIRQSEEIAAGLQIFIDNVPQYEDEISTSLKKLLAISAAIRALETALDPAVCEQLDNRFDKDLVLVLQSLRLTLDTVRRMFGQTRSPRVADDPSYTILWEDLSAAFRYQGGPPLGVRLRWCHSFLQELFDLLRGYETFPYFLWKPPNPTFRRPPAVADIARDRARLRTLVEEQAALDSYLDRVEIGSQGWFHV